jgi:hypothetical protein
MKITNRSFELPNGEEVDWSHVKSIRILNNKLAITLSSRKVIHLENLRPSTIDLLFRTYEAYLREHPSTTKAAAA